MKRITSGMFLALMCSSQIMNAAPVDLQLKQVKVKEWKEEQVNLTEYGYVYRKDGGNWFLLLNGGVSASYGDPLGGGDLFDRLGLYTHFSVGKWLNPHAGVRLSYQYGTLKNDAMTRTNHNSVSVDLLWNVTNTLYGYDAKDVWNFVPYVGMGMGHAHQSRTLNPMLTYGLLNTFKLSPALALNLEFGGQTATRSYDGVGSSLKLGDNLFYLSAGVTVTFGQKGWKCTNDASDYLAMRNQLLSDKLSLTQRHLHEREKALDQLKGLLALEGLLDKYEEEFVGSGNEFSNYSGMIALKKRLQKDGEKFDSVTLFSCGDSIIGAPVRIFFKLNKADLTDECQLLNVEEIAKICIKHHLKVRIDGYADKQTGNKSRNFDLSKERAKVISKYLIKLGVPKERIKGKANGGVDKLIPKQADRNVTLMLLP